ncbi:hypothetical protein A2Z67_06235 [Candidatus Woesebacteria bacterium RBG_13_36_22]|uniref:Uncharacterized protein n=1 Tax=Candidatus Woesebacteria bacterium RBG_13_36_22 TaxID=1802478 RepID=A0A1F7X1K7_9BACT|nr:MAG: hypothetical protein A2Z67_06235 [Candidatus Woesebacteria bacterium RBG_13_36_22]
MANVIGANKSFTANPQRTSSINATRIEDSRAGQKQVNVGAMTRGLGGIAANAERMTQIIRDFAQSAENTSVPAVQQVAAISAKFALDMLVQGSLSEAPEIPAPYFPPLLYCTEYSSVFGSNARTSSIVAFSFRDIGNLFVEDSSQPRAIPIQQVPDADEDNVQDMGRSSGYIKVAGRVFGQAGLARFEMLRNLCNYKGKEGLVFIDQNIGKYRVYPANIPGYTSSAEFFNQYAFQVTFIIVGDTNKKNLTHTVVGESLKYILATANAAEQVKSFLYANLSTFKSIKDTLTVAEQKNELKNVLSQSGENITDEKVDNILNILEYGMAGSATITLDSTQYPEFTSSEGTPVIELRNVVPSKVMDNGFTDGIQTEYWLPAREPGEKLEVYYGKIYNRLTESEILPENQDNQDADKGSRIQGAIWKLQSFNSDYKVVDSMLRPGYAGKWTKLTFSAPLPKWGIVRVHYVVPSNSDIQLYNGDRVLYGEGLLYVDRIATAIDSELIIEEMVPYPISGSSLNVIESAGITELYIPELIDDPVLSSQITVKKREGSINDGIMTKITNFDVIPSTTWVGGRPGKWAKITLTTPLNIGDFVSINAIFKDEVFFYSFAHPDYTINADGSEIVFKWLSRPRTKVSGQIVTNLVLSPNLPTGAGLYNDNFLTDGITTVYWVKNGIDIADDITIKISDGNGILEDMQPSEYVIEAITSRPAYLNNWAKITFNSPLTADRIVAIDCRLGTSMTVFVGQFGNSEFHYGNLIVNLLWQEAVDDLYINSTYRNIYPIPNGEVTGNNGLIPVSGITDFWIPKIVYSELYPLIVKLNRDITGDYTVILEESRVVGGVTEIWTKIVFYQALDQGDILTVDFTAYEEQEIFDLHFLESIPGDLFTDECEPNKNELNAKKYYTTLVIDVSKPIEVKIDGKIVPSSKYNVTGAVNRVHENPDGAIVSQLVGLIEFLSAPGDTVDINVRYNRLETPVEQEIKFTTYLAVDDPKYQIIKDYYTRNILTPTKLSVTDINNRFFSFIKYVYIYPYPDGNEYITYAKNENSVEFIYKKHDGIGEDYTTTVNVYSFQGSSFDAGLYDNMSNFNELNTPFSLDILVPQEGQDDWLGRYNNLISSYPDPSLPQIREITSMLLGKLVDNADFSDETQITDEDMANAKLWLQIYHSYVESEDFIESKKMLDERTKLMELGVDGNPKEIDAVNTVTIPNEEPIPVDLPPISGWRVEELPGVIRYTGEFVNINLYNFYNDNIVNLKTKYRTAVSEGISISILKNNDTMFAYDSSKSYRIRIIVGNLTEEYQFTQVQGLVDSLISGQIVNTDTGPVDIDASQLITDPEIIELQGNQSPRLLNKTIFKIESVDFDKKSYEVFLYAIYGDIDAIQKIKLLSHDKYIQYQEIIGHTEASLTLEEGLQFYKFTKIVPLA